MKCQEIRNLLALYTSQALESSEKQLVETHVEGCVDCRRQLAAERRIQLALERQAVPAPSPDFEHRVIAAATSQSEASRNRWTTPIISGAAAAALAVGVLVGVQYGPGANSGQAVTDASSEGGEAIVSVNGQALGEPQEQTVQLAFRSQQSLDGVTLTLELPENVELDRFPGRQQISWKVNLEEGENVLSLPLKVLYPGSGELVAHLENNGRRKTFRAAIPMNKEPAS